MLKQPCAQLCRPELSPVWREPGYPACRRPERLENRPYRPPGKVAPLTAITRREWLGASPFSSPYLVTWSARMLRLEALEADPEPIRIEFSRFLDAHMPDPRQGRPPSAKFVRAAHAILYLQGELSASQRAAYKSGQALSMDFLWDDP